jgi:hypothetical protein
MKCLTRIEMQGYLDGELDPSSGKEIMLHLQSCEKCSSEYKDAVADKTLLNKLLSIVETGSESQMIPEFRHPVKKSKTIIRFAVVFAAASIIGLIYISRFKKEQVKERIPEAELLIHEFYDGKDLNKMWHEKSGILIIQDEKGNVIKSIITN